MDDAAPTADVSDLATDHRQTGGPGDFADLKARGRCEQAHITDAPRQPYFCVGKDARPRLILTPVSVTMTSLPPSTNSRTDIVVDDCAQAPASATVMV